MHTTRWIRTVALTIFLCTVIFSPSLAKTIYVDDDGVTDFATIQAAINDANDGDVILVALGIYTGDGNRDIDFLGKAITVRSEDGPQTCIIDSQGSEADPHRGFYFHSREGNDSVLEGFTITGGYSDGGGIICYQKSSPSIRNCIVVGNTARLGGGMYLGDSDAVVSNCVITGNCACGVTQVTSRGGGGLACSGGHPTIRNCTINGNRAVGPGGGVYCVDNGTVLFVNCILAGNESGREGAQLFSGGCLMITGCPDIEIVNCCIEDDPNAIFVENWSDPRMVPANCIQADPLFAQPGYWDPNGTPDDSYDDVWIDGDYHLQSQAGRWDPNSESWVADDVTSPCIDAGDPNSDYSAEVWPHGGRINMGAYGGTPEASLSAEPTDLFLPRIACIHWYDRTLAQSLQAFLQAHACPVTLIFSEHIPNHALDDYDLIIIATNNPSPAIWSDTQLVAALTDSGKPVLGLGQGGYGFFGQLNLAIGAPNGARTLTDSVHVIDSDAPLFTGPYPVTVPADAVLQLADTLAYQVVIYMWPAVPENVVTFARQVDDPGYHALATEQGHLLWGFTDSPDELTDAGRNLLLNAVILTANAQLQSPTASSP